MRHPFEAPVKTMEAKVSERWPKGDFVYEPKWDGFRSLSWRGTEARLDSRNQRPLLRYFPELLPAIEQLPPGTVVDGEIVVVIDGATDFAALQQRIHPAESRVNMLSEAMPGELVAFDLLAVEGRDFREEPFANRRAALIDLVADLKFPWHLTPQTSDQRQAQTWFHEFEPAGCDGIIAKKPELAYQFGKRAMIKIKHRRTIDAVVGGFREHKDPGKIGSLLLGLYDEDGDFHFIGHCSGFSDADRVELYHRFLELRCEEARAPGSQSRWSQDKDRSWVSVQQRVVLEVSYDQLEGDRFRHASRFHRWRPDKTAADCTMEQLERPEGLDFGAVVGWHG